MSKPPNGLRHPLTQLAHAFPQVVRHERASIKADIWSYGVLIWELISGQDITELQPLAIARQVQVGPALLHVKSHLLGPRRCGIGLGPDRHVGHPFGCLRHEFADARRGGKRIEGGGVRLNGRALSAAQGFRQHGPTLELPRIAPAIAAHLFVQCTHMDPDLRPSAGQIVEWLRNS